MARISRWIFFVVLASLAPIVADYVAKRSHVQQIPQESQHPFLVPAALVVAHGELLLIAAALAAESIGELVAVGTKNASAKIAAGGSCLLLLVVSSWWYSGIAGSSDVSDQTRIFNTKYSIVIWTATVLIGLIIRVGAAIEEDADDS